MKTPNHPQHGEQTCDADTPRTENQITSTPGSIRERIEATAIRMPTDPTRPEWGDAKAVRARFGICRSTIIRLANEGKIRSSSLRERGKLRGKKLYSLDSVAAFIEKMASGGEGEV